MIFPKKAGKFNYLKNSLPSSAAWNASLSRIESLLGSSCGWLCRHPGTAPGAGLFANSPPVVATFVMSPLTRLAGQKPKGSGRCSSAGRLSCVGQPIRSTCAMRPQPSCTSSSPDSAWYRDHRRKSSVAVRMCGSLERLEHGSLWLRYSPLVLRPNEPWKGDLAVNNARAQRSEPRFESCVSHSIRSVAA